MGNNSTATKLANDNANDASKSGPHLVQNSDNGRATRFAISVFFFFHGACIATWASRIPTIQHTLGMSDTELGITLLGLPIGNILTSILFTGLFVGRLGTKKGLVAATILFALNLCAIGFAAASWQLALALTVFGGLSQLVSNTVYTQAAKLEEQLKKPVVGSMSGLWGVAGFAGAGFGSYMMGQEIVPVQHYALVAAIQIACALYFGRHLIFDQPKPAGARGKFFQKPDAFLLKLALIAFACFMCEGAMFDWSGVYFKSVVGAESGWVGAGYTVFMCAMTAMRFMSDGFTEKYGRRRIVQTGGMLIAAGFLLATAVPTFWPAMLGFLMIGLGCAPVIPLVFSTAGKSKKYEPSVALASVTSIGLFGFLAGPPVIGLVADMTSLRTSFAILIAMGFVMTWLTWRTKEL